MNLPLIIAGVAGGLGILTLTGIAIAAGVRGQPARHLLDVGRFVRGLDMNRRRRDGTVTPHWGVDIAAPEGTPARAVKTGVVVLARPVRGYGNTVMLSVPSERRSFLYGHLQRATVREGQTVPAGAIVGLVGRTRHGRNVRWDGERFVSVGPDSSGVVSPISPHIHFEVHPGPIPRIGSRPRRLDPVDYLRQEGVEMFGRRWEDDDDVDRVA